MTIAAGFCFNDSVLLCADTMYVGGCSKTHNTKIFGLYRDDVRIGVTFAGPEIFAKMTIQESLAEIDSENPEGRSISGIKKIVREHLRTTFADIDTRPNPENHHFTLLIAAWHQTGGLHLFETSTTALSEVDTYRCIGTGDTLGYGAVAPMYKPTLNLDRAVVMASRAILAAKNSDSYCGGPSEFLRITRDGDMSPIRFYEAADTEEAISQYEIESANLLLYLADLRIGEDEVDALINLFVRQVKELRKDWKLRWTAHEKFLETLENMRASLDRNRAYVSASSSSSSDHT